MPPVVSTIIISYNTADLTIHAIESVLANYSQDAIEGEVIVVDNASSDDSVDRIRAQFGKKVIIISNPTNDGFAAANNIGIKQAKGAYYFLLNSDTILKPHAIKHLLYVFHNHVENYATQQLENTPKLIDRVGLVSGMLLNPDGSIQPQGGALPTLINLMSWWLWPLPGNVPLFPARQEYHATSPDFFRAPQQMGWLGGTALLIKREVIDEIGDLDANIFMYAEDVELCWRAQQHHWDIVYTPSAQITHLGSASSSSTRAIIGEIRGLKYVLAKHMSDVQYQLAMIILRIGAHLRMGLFGIILNDAKKKRTYTEIIALLQD